MPTAGEAKIRPTSHYNLRSRPLPKTKSVVGQERSSTIKTRGKENVQGTTTTKGPVARPRSKIPVSSSTTANTKEKVATKTKKTSRRGVPDFAKLHKQWHNKLEKGKAVNKKSCTQIKAFDLTRPGTQFKSAYFDADTADNKAGGDCDSFEEDQMALQSILNERGVVDENCKVNRSTIATSDMRHRAPSSHRKTLGSIPVPQTTRPNRTQSPDIGPKEPKQGLTLKKGRKSVVEEQKDMGIEFEADPGALESILNNTGISHTRAAPPNARQTFATSRGLAGSRGSFYGGQNQKRISIYDRPQKQKSIREVYEDYTNMVMRRLTLGEDGPAPVLRPRAGGVGPSASTVRTSIYRGNPSTSCRKPPFHGHGSATKGTPGRVAKLGPQNQPGNSSKPLTPASRVPNPHFHTVLQRQEISSSPLLSGSKQCQLTNTAKKKVQWAEDTVSIPSAEELATSLFLDQPDDCSEERKQQLEKKREVEESEKQLELEKEILSALNDDVDISATPTTPSRPPLAGGHRPVPSERGLTSKTENTPATLRPMVAWQQPAVTNVNMTPKSSGFKSSVVGTYPATSYRGDQDFTIVDTSERQYLPNVPAGNVNAISKPSGFSSSMVGTSPATVYGGVQNYVPGKYLNAESQSIQKLALHGRPISHTGNDMTSVRYTTIGRSVSDMHLTQERTAGFVSDGRGCTIPKGNECGSQANIRGNGDGGWSSQTYLQSMGGAAAIPAGSVGKSVSMAPLHRDTYGETANGQTMRCEVSISGLPPSQGGTIGNATNAVPLRNVNYGCPIDPVSGHVLSPAPSGVQRSRGGEDVLLQTLINGNPMGTPSLQCIGRGPSTPSLVHVSAPVYGIPETGNGASLTVCNFPQQSSTGFINPPHMTSSITIGEHRQGDTMHCITSGGQFSSPDSRRTTALGQLCAYTSTQLATPNYPAVNPPMQMVPQTVSAVAPDGSSLSHQPVRAVSSSRSVSCSQPVSSQYSHSYAPVYGQVLSNLSHGTSNPSAAPAFDLQGVAYSVTTTAPSPFLRQQPVERQIPLNRSIQQGVPCSQQCTSQEIMPCSPVVRAPFIGSGQNDSSPFAPIGRVEDGTTQLYRGQIVKPQVTTVTVMQRLDTESAKASVMTESSKLQTGNPEGKLLLQDGKGKLEQGVLQLTDLERLPPGATKVELATLEDTAEEISGSLGDGNTVVSQSEIDDFLATTRGEGLPEATTGGKVGLLSLRSEMPQSASGISASTMGKAPSLLKDVLLDQECTLYAHTPNQSPSGQRTDADPIAKIFAGKSNTYFCPILEDGNSSHG